MEKPVAKCPNCGELFGRLKDGKIPTHDFPKPCRSVCKGSGQEPREKNDHRPLWRDAPEQEAKDFYEAARDELRLYGFAVVKQMALFSGKAGGHMQCPLCLKQVRFSVASSNKHCAAKCETDGCINAME